MSAAAPEDDEPLPPKWYKVRPAWLFKEEEELLLLLELELVPDPLCALPEDVPEDPEVQREGWSDAKKPDFPDRFAVLLVDEEGEPEEAEGDPDPEPPP